MFIEPGAVAIHFVAFPTLVLLACDVNSLMSNEVVIRGEDSPTLIARESCAMDFLVFDQVTILGEALPTFRAPERPFVVVHSAVIQKAGFLPK